jgi:hypothetical protein
MREPSQRGAARGAVGLSAVTTIADKRVRSDCLLSANNGHPLACFLHLSVLA